MKQTAARPGGVGGGGTKAEGKGEGGSVLRLAAALWSELSEMLIKNENLLKQIHTQRTGEWDPAFLE